MKNTKIYIVCTFLVTASVIVYFNGQSLLQSETAQATAANGMQKTNSKDLAKIVPGGSPSNDNPFPTLAPANSELPIEEEVIHKAEKVTLWQSIDTKPQVDSAGIPSYKAQVSPGALEQFHVGQTIDVRIPQRDSTIKTSLTSTHNQLGNVKVWKGKVLSGSKQDNIIVTQGRIETHINISTEEGTYTAIIDNKTGVATIVDEGDINARQIPIDDGIHVHPVEDTPPTPIS